MATGKLRHVRITNSGKLADRYLTVQVKQPNDPEKRDNERFFAIIEIENPLYPTAQISQTIINTTSREYYRGEERDPIINFERALRKANETLAYFSRTGEVEWVGKLHGILALVVGTDVHIAPTGAVHAWLIRDGKATRAIEQAPAETLPEKTFGAVISGTLEPGDELLLASSGLINVMPEPELATLFDSPDFPTTALRLATQLRSKRAQWVNAVLIEATRKGKRDQLATPLADTLYLDTGNLTDWRITAASTARTLHGSVLKAGSWFKRANSHIDKALRTHITPRLSQINTWSRSQFERLKEKSAPSKIASEPILAPEFDDISIATETKPPISTAPSLIGKNLYVVHDYAAPEPAQTAANSAQSVPQRIREYSVRSKPISLPKLNLPSMNTLRSSFQNLTHGNYRIIWLPLATVALTVILVGNLYAMTKHSAIERARADAQATLTTLDNKFEEAKLAKILNQTDKAINGFQTVISGTEMLMNSPAADNAAQLQSDAKAQLDNLTNTTRINEPELLTPIASGTALTLWGSHLSIKTMDESVQTIATTGGDITSTTLNETPIALTGLDETEALVVLSKKPAVYRLTTSSNQPEQLSVTTGSWNNGIAIAPFANSLYILAPNDNQIWKYPVANGAYSEAVQYITDGTDISKAIDIAIQGSVFALTSDGQVLKFTRGKISEFRIRDIPKPDDALTQPKQIRVAKDGNIVFILDGDRIVTLDKTGRFQKQYALGGKSGHLMNFAISDDTKTIYILTDTALYQAAL